MPPWGLAVGARNMTVSTSGLVPRIIQFADQPVQIRLAISLHAATDEVRSKIMPVNRKHPLRELMDACQYYCSRKSQPLTLEYILIRGLNDFEDQACRLVDHARRLRAKVNLIPYNQVKGLDWKRPSRRGPGSLSGRLEGAMAWRRHSDAKKATTLPQLAASCASKIWIISRQQRLTPISYPKINA